MKISPVGFFFFSSEEKNIGAFIKCKMILEYSSPLEKVRNRENNASILIWYILRKAGIQSRKCSGLQKYEV